MFLLRRAAVRAVASSPSASFISKPRSITTLISPLCRVEIRSTSTPFQRRFASNGTAPLSEDTTTDETVTEQASSGSVLENNQAATSPSITEEPVEAAAPAAASAPAATEGRPAVNAPVDPAFSQNILYVGNLFFEVTEEALERQFAAFGKVVKTKIVYDHRGLSKGFGYIEFEKPEDAAAAVDSTNQQVFQGRRMAVQFHRRKESRSLTRPRAQNDPTKTLFIGNMSFEMSDKDLNDLFREIRNVLDVRVAIDRRTGQPRGFAHADFIDVESASKAKVILEGKEIYGRQLRVDYSMASSGTRPS